MRYLIAVVVGVAVSIITLVIVPPFVATGLGAFAAGATIVSSHKAQ